MDLSFLPSFMTQPMQNVGTSGGLPVCTIPATDPANTAGILQQVAANCPQLIGQPFSILPGVTYQMSTIGWATLGLVGLLAFKMMK